MCDGNGWFGKTCKLRRSCRSCAVTRGRSCTQTTTWQVSSRSRAALAKLARSLSEASCRSAAWSGPEGLLPCLCLCAFKIDSVEASRMYMTLQHHIPFQSHEEPRSPSINCRPPLCVLSSGITGARSGHTRANRRANLLCTFWSS